VGGVARLAATSSNSPSGANSMLTRQPEDKQTSNLHAALQNVQIQLRTFVKILPHRPSIITVCFTNLSNPNHAPRDYFVLQNMIKHNLYFFLTGKESKSNDVREENFTTQLQVLLKVECVELCLYSPIRI